MRIAYVLNTLAVGGTERQVVALSRRMAARGHAAVLLVLRPREPDELDAADLQVIHLDVTKSASSLLAGVARGTACLRQFCPDLVHSHNFHGNMLARLIRLSYSGPKLISTIHNVYEGGWPRMLAYRLTDRLVHRTTAVSNAVADRFTDLKAVARRKCAVVTNGIETTDFVPDIKRRAAMRAQMGVTDEFVWLCVARNTPAKDIPNLLQAFGKIWENGPKIVLWRAGHDSADGALSAMYAVSTLPLGALDGIRRLGPRRDIPALLDAADGFVLASAWEGMPLALGEAMAMEKPVVATDVGGVRELVGDAGIIVPAKDADALGDAMLRVMRQPRELTAELGRAARQRILAKFDMDTKADEWETLYRAVLA
jgi:glycosyltransferase involved in cell wall biosynthesis